MSLAFSAFLLLRSLCQVLLLTEPVPSARGSRFAFPNSTGIFLPSSPFPLGARQTVNGRNQSIEEFRSLQIENSSTVFQFPATKRFDLACWRIPSAFCPAPSFLLNADFHIFSRTSFYSAADLCFFADPRGLGYRLSITATSPHIISIQFFVNNSNHPYYECASLYPNQTFTCSSPFVEPFFVRIEGAGGANLALEIEYTVRYSEETTNGCFVSQIPTTFLAAEDSPVLQPQNFCVTLQQQTMRIAVKLSALVAILLATAVMCQWLGYWDFRGWTAVPGGVQCPDMLHGTVSVEFDALRLLGPTPFLLQPDSDSSPLSDLGDDRPFR
jgi:hypothetical protein